MLCVRAYPSMSCLVVMEKVFPFLPGLSSMLPLWDSLSSRSIASRRETLWKHLGGTVSPRADLEGYRKLNCIFLLVCMSSMDTHAGRSAWGLTEGGGPGVAGGGSELILSFSCSTISFSMWIWPGSRLREDGMDSCGMGEGGFTFCLTDTCLFFLLFLFDWSSDLGDGVDDALPQLAGLRTRHLKTTGEPLERRRRVFVVQMFQVHVLTVSLMIPSFIWRLILEASKLRSGLLSSVIEISPLKSRVSMYWAHTHVNTDHFQTSVT